MVQMVRGVLGMGLSLGVGALPLAAQSMALPAVNPVGIARSGAQVAYGYSLEAASLNPALLSSLKGAGSAYLAIGLELSSTQQSMESNQQAGPKSYFSTDRNRSVGAFGLALSFSPQLTLGLKLDEPFLRHGKLLDDAPSRYQGDGLDLAARRLEGQVAWALSPNLSVGLGLGVARLSFDSSNVVRLGVPNDPTQPASGTNAVNGLVEQRVGQSGNKVVPSYSLGVRWALSPRWTFGFTHQSGLKGDLPLTAEFRDASLGYFLNDGLGSGPVGLQPRAATLLATAQVVKGTGTLELPSQTTLGMRHRFLPNLTWEADLRWTSGNLRVPSFAAVTAPSGTVTAPSELPQGRGHLGFSTSAEVELGKLWTIRGGLAMDQRSVEEGATEPMLGGTRTSGFSLGAGYKVWGGELSLGYQYRQSEDQDTRNLYGVWSSTGFRSAGTKVRMEGMGHLMAIGFRRAF